MSSNHWFTKKDSKRLNELICKNALDLISPMEVREMNQLAQKRDYTGRQPCPHCKGTGYKQ
jgi:hypothetical protein